MVGDACFGAMNPRRSVRSQSRGGLARSYRRRCRLDARRLTSGTFLVHALACGVHAVFVDGHHAGGEPVAHGMWPAMHGLGGPATTGVSGRQELPATTVCCLEHDAPEADRPAVVFIDEVYVAEICGGAAVLQHPWRIRVVRHRQDGPGIAHDPCCGVAEYLDVIQMLGGPRLELHEHPPKDRRQNQTMPPTTKP